MAVFQFTFADPSGEGERPLRCPALQQRTQPRALYLLCPRGWTGGRAGRSVRKHTERSEPAPQLSDARPERAAAAPPSRSLSPAGKEAGPSAGTELGNLNRPSSPPRPRL